MSISEEDFIGYCSVNEAIEKHVTQLGTSACGVTALVNILLMMDIVEKDALSSIKYQTCMLRSRANDAPLPQYLISRHNAGCTGEELVESMKKLLEENNLAEDLIECHFVPYKDIVRENNNVIDFLSEKFKEGYLGIATMNLQLVGNDAWHHQLVFGIHTKLRSVFAMNPLEMIPEKLLDRYLSTDSVLLVRREDVLLRINRPGADYQLLEQPGWREFSIRDQIEAMRLDESFCHLMIPAAYNGGIALFKKKKLK